MVMTVTMIGSECQSCAVHAPRGARSDATWGLEVRGSDSYGRTELGSSWVKSMLNSERQLE